MWYQNCTTKVWIVESELHISVIEYLLECFDKHPAKDIVMAEYHNPDVPLSQVDEDDRSDETAAAKKGRP